MRILFFWKSRSSKNQFSLALLIWNSIHFLQIVSINLIKLLLYHRYSLTQRTQPFAYFSQDTKGRNIIVIRIDPTPSHIDFLCTLNIQGWITPSLESLQMKKVKLTPKLENITNLSKCHQYFLWFQHFSANVSRKQTN